METTSRLHKSSLAKMDRYDRLRTWTRFLLFLSCGILFICGLVLLGIGAWMRYGAATVVDVLGPYSDQLVNISYICIAMGAVLAFTALTGCCGAWKENRFFILLFFFIVTMLFVAEIVGTIFIFVYRDLISLMVRQASRKSLVTAYMGPAATDPISSAWNTVMIKFKCCGFENSTLDFLDSAFSQATGLMYPKTCCVMMSTEECDGVNTDPELIQPQSCFSKIIAVIKAQGVILGSTAGGICLIELASMTIAMVLFIKLGIMRRC